MFKKIFIIFLSLFLTLTIIIILFNAFFSWKKPAPRESDRIIVNDTVVYVETAENYDEWARGLSDRENLCFDCGMLFIYPNKDVRMFWMKNMNFPLDILWIDGEKIVKIDKNLLPEGDLPEILYSSETPVNYVLEVNAGFVDQSGLKEGDLIKYFLNN